MVCLVEEEVSVTPYFLQLKADLCFFKSSFFFPAPLNDVRHTLLFLVGRERPRGRDVFYRLGRRRKCTKNSTCAVEVILPFGASRRRLFVFSASYFH